MIGYPATTMSVIRAVNDPSVFTIMERASTRAFSWLKVPTTAFIFKTLLRHYAKRALTPRSLNVKLGPQRKGHNGQVGWFAKILKAAAQCHIFTSTYCLA